MLFPLTDWQSALHWTYFWNASRIFIKEFVFYAIGFSDHLPSTLEIKYLNTLANYIQKVW